jgi:hypothetical protein
LAISTHQPREEPCLESELATYTSNVLRLFVEGLGGRQGGQVLDMGPVCGSNISFFAQRVKKHYVCDMFLHLDRNLRNGLPLSRIGRDLDYPPQSFDGILLWDLIDHLDDSEVRRVVEMGEKMVRPGGMVMVIALGEQVIDQVVNSFVIGDGFRLYLRPQPHLDLPLHFRQNREVLALLAPFRPVKSFIYRNGIREFLFQRDKVPKNSRLADLITSFVTF